MSGFERLGRQDRIALWPDEAGWQQDIGVVARLDGDRLLDGDDCVRLDVVLRWIETRLPRVPRMRQVVYVPRFGLGPPLWVDAASFDLRDHVHAVAPLRPGDEAQLWATVEQLRRRRLDPKRPLWEAWFIPVPEARTVWVYFRVHHVIADGVSGVAMLGALLDPEPVVDVSPPHPHEPAPPPSDRALFKDTVGRCLTELTDAAGACAHPATIWRSVQAG